MRIIFYVCLLCVAAGAFAQDFSSEDQKPPAVPGSTFQDCPDCPEMVVMPAGSFDMGSNDADDEEKPVRRVTLSRAFAMGRTEVTRGQWRAIMGDNSGECGDNCPVEQVSWDAAQEFIRRLNQKTGRYYRLPSESEWEYACRAGGAQEYCGSDSVDSVAWTDKNSGKTAHKVAAKLPNAFGLYDMSGNVWEWIEDGSHDNYKGAPTDGSAWPGAGLMHMLRGGSWSGDPLTARAANRYGLDAAESSDGIGFRLVRQ